MRRPTATGPLPHSGSDPRRRLRNSGLLVLLVPAADDRHRIGDMRGRIEVGIGIEDLAARCDDVGSPVGVCGMLRQDCVVFLHDPAVRVGSNGKLLAALADGETLQLLYSNAANT